MGKPRTDRSRTADSSDSDTRGLQTIFTALPGALVAVIPGVACPACIPAYAGLLSSLGVTWLAQSSVLIPIMIGALSLQLGIMGWGWYYTRKPGPFIATSLGVAAIVTGRIIWSIPTLLYVGIALFMGAALWNFSRDRPTAPASVIDKLIPRNRDKNNRQ